MSDGPGRRILCIDDDQDVLESYQAILSNAGYEVVATCDGDAGLAEARRQRPDLIILDVMMRDMTEGFDVSYKLREDDGLRNVPILMVTGVSSHLNARFALTHGGAYLPVDAFIDKPAGPETLLDAVALCLRSPAQGGSARL